jgi:hypothetical protein
MYEACLAVTEQSNAVVNVSFSTGISQSVTQCDVGAVSSGNDVVSRDAAQVMDASVSHSSASFFPLFSAAVSDVIRLEASGETDAADHAFNQAKTDARCCDLCLRRGDQTGKNVSWHGLVFTGRMVIQVS